MYRILKQDLYRFINSYNYKLNNLIFIRPGPTSSPLTHRCLSRESPSPALPRGAVRRGAVAAAAGGGHGAGGAGHGARCSVEDDETPSITIITC